MTREITHFVQGLSKNCLSLQLLQLHIPKTHFLPSLLHNIISWTSSMLPMWPEGRVALCRGQEEREVICGTRRRRGPSSVSDVPCHVVFFSVYSYDIFRWRKNLLAAQPVAANLLMWVSFWLDPVCEAWVTTWDGAAEESINVFQWHTFVTSDPLLNSSF